MAHQRNGSNGSDEPYELRAERANRQYQLAYKEWVRGLTPAQYAELEAAMVANPEVVHYRTYTPPEPPQFPDRPIRILEPEPKPITHDASEAVGKLVLHLLGSNNVQLQLFCVAYVLGFCDMAGLSQERIAAKFGLCKAAFSKRCKRLQAEWGLRPSRVMKSSEACQQYVLTNGRPRQSP